MHKPRNSFYINAVGNSGGPKIFGSRLKNGLERRGWIFDIVKPQYNISFVSGGYSATSENILRLDGLYFDTDNTLGDTNKLNEPLNTAYNIHDKIVFQSEWSRDMFFHHFGITRKPYEVIYNGVPYDLVYNATPIKFPFKKTLICSGRWRRHKRLEETIAGFKKLNDFDVGLVILGRHAIAGLPENIISLGDVPPESIFKALKGADAFVSLSWLDSCPNTVVEALACGLPVLCSHNGGTKELVKNSGIVLKLEEDFNLERIALYSPPKVDTDLIAKGMRSILDMKEYYGGVIRPDLNIERVINSYMDFMKS
jgi:glycosyltransferase involved in cell wall biosynthesis